MRYEKAATSVKPRLFDASAILLLAKNHPEQASTILENQLRLDLTLYEIGNAVWKINKLINKSTKQVALEAVEQAYDMVALMDVRRVEGGEDVVEVMDIAYENGLTFYDSCYLYVASKTGTSLVSEDKDIVRAAKKRDVKCVSAASCIGDA
jgi:predicted nucleic acid-binding protein